MRTDAIAYVGGVCIVFPFEELSCMGHRNVFQLRRMHKYAYASWIVKHIALVHPSVSSTGTQNSATNKLYFEIHFEFFFWGGSIILLNVASERHAFLFFCAVWKVKIKTKRKTKLFLSFKFNYSESELLSTELYSSWKCLHQNILTFQSEIAYSPRKFIFCFIYK